MVQITVYRAENKMTKSEVRLQIYNLLNVNRLQNILYHY